MAKVEFHRDENDISQVLNLLNELEQRAIHEKEYRKIYALVLNGLDLLRRHGTPAINSLVELQHEDGSPYSIKMVKYLKRHDDLYEFRVNWREVGAFRAVFFEFELQGDTIIYLTRAVIKEETYSPEFDAFAKESETIKEEVLKDPLEYFKEKGDDSNE